MTGMHLTLPVNISTIFLEEVVPGNKCFLYNTTNPNIILDAYEGIPQTLILNLIGWMILVLLFTILRKRAWNYGRIALVQKSESNYRWTQLFYGSLDEVTGASDNDSNSLSSLDSSIYIDRGFFSWIPAIFKIRKADILQKCGPDAVQYLSFQQHIIMLLIIITITSLGLILPINYVGKLGGDDRTFGHTTVSNLDPNSPFLWTHVTVAILYLPIAIFIMRRFSLKAKIQEVDLSSSKTLMITNIPRRNCDLDDLHRHFREAYPDVVIQEIQLAYDIRKVSILDKEKEKMYQAKLFCENYVKRTNMRLDMRPYACGNICVCCDVMGCPKVDALDFYTAEETKLIQEVDNERAVALKRPLGIIFVTFGSAEDAKRTFADFKSNFCSKNVGTSTVSQSLNPEQWQVAFAPSRTDIFWENLAVSTKYWYMRAFFINFLLFCVLFFLTTPAYIVNLVNTIPLTNKIEEINPLLSQFLPTLLLWTVAALLPVLVSYSDQWLSHWTRSEQNHSIMTKTFMFLLLMVIILPSVGLTSAQALVEWTLHMNETYRWECLFLPDKGAFFVNYITTSAFIGTGMELIRFPELFVYVIRLCLARSEAEIASVRKAILWEFPFGVQYAWMLLIFALTTIYSVSCPLIAPFGVVYMLQKHMVDKYNLYFAYGPSKISPKIHATAINIVIFSVVLLQASFLALSILRKGMNDIAIYSLIGFVLTLMFFCFHSFFSWCKGFSPISYQPRRLDTADSMESSPTNTSGRRFVPEVLESPRRSDSIDISEQTNVVIAPDNMRNYGSRNDEGYVGHSLGA